MNSNPKPLKTKCFQCSQVFFVKFVIARQAYSQKNSWAYWTGQKGEKKICDACLRTLYYDKEIYWKAIQNPKKRALLRVYLSAGKI